MLTYPNLYHLKYFADAVDLGSISGAARMNLVTHPAISRAISALEKQLGLRLLDHQRKFFKVTTEGHRVARQARRLLESASNFHALKLESEAAAGTVSVGMSRTLSDHYLSRLLEEVASRFPNARTHVHFGTTTEITEAVAKNSIDLGITIGTQNFPTLKQSVVRTGKFLLVEAASNRNHRDSFESKRFILTEPRFETELLKRSYQRQFARALPVMFEIRSWEVIGQFVQKGHGVGLLPDLAITNWNKNAYRVLRPQWFDCEYEVYVHHSRTPARNFILQSMLDSQIF